MKSLLVILLSAGLVLCVAYMGKNVSTPVLIEPPETFSGAGEQIVFDDLSLWHSPSNSGISYNSFEPVRVRREGAEYIFRQDTGDKRFAGSGRNYGEIRLTEADGGIMYLPRWLPYDEKDSLRLLLRQKSDAGSWRISVYRSADEVAHVTAASPAVKIRQSGDWQHVTISLRKLSYEPFSLKLPKKKNWSNPNLLLSQYNAPQGHFYALGFSLAGGKAGDSLYIDRMTVKKPVHTKAGVVSGKLVPALRDAAIILRSDRGERTAAVESNGAFTIEIPKGAKIIEVVADAGDRVISPRAGRYMEVGTYLPKIVFPTQDDIIKKAPSDGYTNDGLYVYEEKYGPRVEPLHNFLVQVGDIKGQTVTASELVTNALGYIDRDRDKKNINNAYRVMLLGECHHMGLHIAQAESWWNEAEAVAVMRAKRPIEFINASFNHASFTSSWPAYRDLGADMSPDIVLLPMIDPGVLNLTIEEYMMDWLGASKGHRPAYQFELDAEGKIVHKANDPDWQLYREPLPEAEHKRIRAQYVSLPYVHADPAQDPQWVKDNLKLATASLTEFAKLAKARDTRFAILYISNFGATKTAPITEEGKTYDPNRFRDIMRKMAEDAGLEFIDVSMALHMAKDGRDQDRMFFNSNGHFTPYAHYRYGQVLGNLFSDWVNSKTSEDKKGKEK